MKWKRGNVERNDTLKPGDQSILVLVMWEEEDTTFGRDDL